MTTLEKLLFWKAAGGGSPLYERTIINNPAVFTTEVAKPLKGLSIPFLPKQSGSGDPSPSNIRPIAGWTGLNINRTGKNVFNKAYLSDPASYKNEASGYPYTDAIYLAPNTTYTLTPSSTEQLETANYYVLYINPSETDPDYLIITNPAVRYPVAAGKPKWITFTTGATGVIRFGTYTNSLAAFMSIDWQLEVGGTSSEYEPYTEPTIIPVSWQTEAGTVYGGTLDALTGVLTVQFEIESSTWGAIKRTGGSGYDYGYLEFTNRVKYQGSGASASNSFCNVGKYVYATEIYGEPHFYIGTASAGNIIRGLIYLPMGTDDDTPVQVAGELETPFTVQLDPVSLSTLIGENVIWTDTNSDNTIVYLSKTQGGGLGGGFGGGFGSGSDDPGDPENPDDPIEPDDPIDPDDPEIPEEPVTDE